MKAQFWFDQHFRWFWEIKGGPVNGPFKSYAEAHRDHSESLATLAPECSPHRAATPGSAGVDPGDAKPPASAGAARSPDRPPHPPADKHCSIIDELESGKHGAVPPIVTQRNGGLTTHIDHNGDGSVITETVNFVVTREELERGLRKPVNLERRLLARKLIAMRARQ